MSYLVKKEVDGTVYTVKITYLRKSVLETANLFNVVEENNMRTTSYEYLKELLTTLPRLEVKRYIYKPYATIVDFKVKLENGDFYVFYGVSRCNPKDIFKKKLGRKIALERGLKEIKDSKKESYSIFREMVKDYV